MISSMIVSMIQTLIRFSRRKNVFRRWKNRTNFFPNFYLNLLNSFFFKFGLSRLNPIFSNGPKLPQNPHLGFFPAFGLSRVNSNLINLGVSTPKPVAPLWLNSKRCGKTWFLGNCPYGLWLAASGARQLAVRPGGGRNSLDGVAGTVSEWFQRWQAGCCLH